MTISELMIRAAYTRDLPLLGPLEDRAGQRFKDSRHPYCASFPHFDVDRLAALAQAGTVWVAVDAGDEPIGFVIADRWGDDGYVHELDVEEAYGRRGVGRRLLGRVAEWARDDGASSLLLSTFSDVPWNAPFYARLGFAVVPLDAYTTAMLAQRQSDAAAGMPLASRVMMRAPLASLVNLP
jgi:GNAT superfamily N-acetyltransferase